MGNSYNPMRLYRSMPYLFLVIGFLVSRAEIPYSGLAGSAFCAAGGVLWIVQRIQASRINRLHPRL